MLDETHDPARRSWIEAANAPGADFPIQNLPWGVARPRGTPGLGRVVVAIGDRALNGLMALGPAAWRGLRRAIARLLDAGHADATLQGAVQPMLSPLDRLEMLLPAAIGDYTDFFAAINHATNTGRMFRPDNPLLPNYKWLPIAYHGRASSVQASGAPVIRPNGQRKPPDAEAPVFGPSRRLDIEAELGIFLGSGNALGRPVPIGRARDHLFGVCLLNDWSARDLQAWEYQPLGPFLAKSFLTSISPWVVTFDALAPFRAPAYARAVGDPAPLPYLADPADQAAGAVAITIEVALATAKMRADGRAPVTIARVDARELYWTPAQMVAHHTSNGCNLRPGDLFGSGTISGAEPGTLGSLLELSEGGKTPIALPNGESRTFLEDGDEIVMRGSCARDGAVPIGLGECRGVVQGAM